MKTACRIIILVLCAAAVHSAKYAVTKTYSEKTKGLKCQGLFALSVDAPLDKCVKTGKKPFKSKKATLADNKIKTESFVSEDCTGKAGSTTTQDVGKCNNMFNIAGANYAVFTDAEVASAKAGGLVLTKYTGSNECKETTGHFETLTIYDASWNKKCYAGAIGAYKRSWVGNKLTENVYSKAGCSGTPTKTTTATLNQCTNTSATTSEMYSSDIASPASLPLLAFNALMFALVVGVTLLQ